MQENYSYPLDESWSQAEMVTVIALYNAVESVYESGIKREDFLQKYRDFQQVVPMKMEQRRFDREFETESGYSIYRAFQQSQQTKANGRVKIQNASKRN